MIVVVDGFEVVFVKYCVVMPLGVASQIQGCAHVFILFSALRSRLL